MDPDRQRARQEYLLERAAHYLDCGFSLDEAKAHAETDLLTLLILAYGTGGQWDAQKDYDEEREGTFR